MPQGTSPIWSQVETPGSLNGPSMIHLLNPIGSGKVIKLRHLRVYLSVGLICKVRRTSSPVDLAGAGATLANDLPLHMDERDVTSIVGELRGTNFPNGQTFSIAESQWVFTMENGSLGQIVFDSLDFSETINAGSAVEIVSASNGAGQVMRAFAIWDEENA
jgi:hypothetical protein